jgi:hypothetical protein
MATGVILDALAQERVQPLLTALAKDFGMGATQKDLINALVYGATSGQAFGMLAEFTKAKTARDEALQAVQDGDPA